MATTGTDQALEFLRKFHPKGLWTLTSIQPDRKKIETRTFTSDNADAAHKWVSKYNGKRNIYFSANQPKEPVNKKADKKDMGRAVVLHADLDCRAGEPPEEELERLRLLVEEGVGWPENLPRPQVATFSGGGYQIFHVLDKHVELGGNLELATDFERYNKAIELALGADNCHNVDRIMRLPGTLNIPDAKKLKKGRVPVEARLVFFNEGETVSLDQFTPVPKVQEQGDSVRGKVNVDLGNIKRVEDINDLDEWNVKDSVKVIIVQGRIPDPEDWTDKQKNFSRSEWCFYALCALARCQVPDDTIFSIITDPQFAISEHVLHQKSVERYAVRQIERAKEWVVEPMLGQLNERYAVIKNLGGKCLVVEDVFDAAANRRRLTKMSAGNFSIAWMNKQVQIGKRDSDGKAILKPAGKFWLEHPLRREYDYLVFSPGKEIPGCYNLWQGFAVEPKEGDCSLFLGHVRDNICGENTRLYDYLLGWMARAVQLPARQGDTAVVLRGRQGTGKSFFIKMFGELFGRHFLHVSNAKHLVGNFNHHLRDCVVLFGDEAFYAGDKKHESVLKTLVTESVLQYEAKGVDAEQGPNYVHLLMASNSEWVVPTAKDDRRFFVLDVMETQAKNGKYFGDIAQQMDTGGREALLHFLMHYDLTGFEVRDIPETLARREQQDFSREPWEQAFYEVLDFGMSPDHTRWTTDPRLGPDWISVDGLMKKLPQSMQNADRNLRMVLGKYLAKQARLNKDGKPVTRKMDRMITNEFGKKERVQLRFFRMRTRPELCHPTKGLGQHYEFDSPEVQWGCFREAGGDASDCNREQIPF